MFQECYTDGLTELSASEGKTASRLTVENELQLKGTILNYESVEKKHSLDEHAEAIMKMLPGSSGLASATLSASMACRC